MKEDAVTIDAAPSVGSWRGIRELPALRWLGHRMSYVVGMPVLMILGLFAGLAVPRFLDPVAFGGYALLLNLFRYASRGDLGLSQLADRRIAASTRPDEDVGLVLVQSRAVLGLLSFACLTPLAVAFAAYTGLVSPLDAALATGAGTVAMVAGGPSSVFRAGGRVWEYTALSFMFCVGFIVPRLIGLLLGGVTGCFLALLAWYVLVVAIFVGRHDLATPWRLRAAALPSLLATSFPLFVFSAAWVVYLSASRWVSAGLSDAEGFGLFAFAANLSTTAVTTFGGLADVRYPRWLGRLAVAGPGGHSGAVAAEVATIVAVVAAAVLVFLPLNATILHVAFPAYAGATGAAAALAISCVPLAAFSWFLPVAVAMSDRPSLDAAVALVPAAGVMVAGMVLGDRLLGVEGQSWACCASALVALAGLLAVLRRERILSWRGALAAGASALVATALLAAIAVSVQAAPTGARGSSSSSPTTMPPPGWRAAFQDDFRNLDLWDGSSGTWQPAYPWGGRTNPTSGEREWYVDDRVPAERSALQGVKTLSVVPGGLAVDAVRVPAGGAKTLGGKPYASGILNSSHSFAFTYGYAEMRATLPAGVGLWPAFWLLPASLAWPPEVDVMESIGGEVDRYWATLHSGSSVPSSRKGVAQFEVAVRGRFEGPHDYGLLWTAEKLAWYLDGRRVAAVDTPADMHGPMYLLLNLAVGGDWAGEPTGATVFPARMLVERVRVLQDPHADPALVELSR